MKRAPKFKRRIPDFARAIVVAVVLAVLGYAALQLSRAEEETPAGPDMPSATSTAEETAGQIIVKYRSDVAGPETEAVAEAVGADEEARIPQLHVKVLKVPPSQRQAILAKLKADPRVEYAEPDTLIHADAEPNDPEYPVQWAWPKVSADLLWDKHTGNFSVAVLDTGVNKVPDLAGKILPGGYDFRNDDDDPADDDSIGHGTAVASVIAANTNNGLGIAGACWGCRILPLKILSAEGSGNDSDMAQAIVYAVDHGIKLMNISVSSDVDTKVRKDAVDYAASKGVVIVGSAGNEGNDLPRYPSSYPDAISVAATLEDDTLRDTSTYGDTVDIAAPGEARVANSTDDSYKDETGTSFSAPVVTGILAVLWSAFPNATPAQLREAITSTADPCCDGKVPNGLINASKAYDLLATMPTPPPTPPPTTPPPTTPPPTTPPPTTPPGGTPKPGDLNQDSQVDLTDLSILLSNWNQTGSGITGDIDQSGTVDLTDLSTLLSNWS